MCKGDVEGVRGHNRGRLAWNPALYIPYFQDKTGLMTSQHELIFGAALNLSSEKGD